MDNAIWSVKKNKAVPVHTMKTNRGVDEAE
jgi:hypothetical protein